MVLYRCIAVVLEAKAGGWEGEPLSLSPKPALCFVPRLLTVTSDSPFFLTVAVAEIWKSTSFDTSMVPVRTPFPTSDATI